MICPSCGKNIEGDRSFCEKCGWKNHDGTDSKEGDPCDDLKSYENRSQERDIVASFKKRLGVGIICKVIFWITVVIIVLHSAVFSFLAGEYVLMILKLMFFPITYFLWPWVSGLWWLWLISMACFIISTTYGRMEPDELCLS